MDIKTARAAIEAILESIPDDALPSFDRVEAGDDDRVTVWWGGTGHILGSAKSNGERDPLNYRRHASWDAIEGEMTYRADRRFLENGDSAKGFKLTGKKVPR